MGLCDLVDAIRHGIACMTGAKVTSEIRTTDAVFRIHYRWGDPHIYHYSEFVMPIYRLVALSTAEAVSEVLRHIAHDMLVNDWLEVM